MDHLAALLSYLNYDNPDRNPNAHLRDQTSASHAVSYDEGISAPHPVKQCNNDYAKILPGRAIQYEIYPISPRIPRGWLLHPNSQTISCGFLILTEMARHIRL